MSTEKKPNNEKLTAEQIRAATNPATGRITVSRLVDVLNRSKPKKLQK